MSIIIDSENSIVSIIKDKLTPFYHVYGTGYDIFINSIHNNVDICFRGYAREILHAIEECIYHSFFPIYKTRVTFFRESIFGKTIEIPLRIIEKNIQHLSFSLFDHSFRIFYKKRFLILESYYFKHNINIHHLVLKRKESFKNYFIVFYIHSLPFDIKKMIRHFLIYNYKSLYFLRKLYDTVY